MPVTEKNEISSPVDSLLFRVSSESGSVDVLSDDDNVIALFTEPTPKSAVKEVLEELSDRVNFNTEIKAIISLKNSFFPQIVKTLLTYGFGDPGVKLDNVPSLVLSRKNGVIEKSYYNLKEFENINALLENFDSWIESGMKKTMPCSLTVQLSPSALKNLDRMVNIYKFTDDDKTLNKEFSGVFTVAEISQKKGLYVYKLDVDSTHISVGGNDNVNGVDKCFTYHTHPKTEYQNIKVTSAWPSMTDIETVLDLLVNSSGVLHVLAGLEGLYFISISPKWANSLDKLSEKMKDDMDSLTEFYRIPYPEEGQTDGVKTPEQYIKKVSKNSAPLQIQFRKWDDTTPVSISNTRVFGENNVMFCKCDL